MTTLKIGREDWLEFPPELERLAMGGITTPPGFVASGVACGLKESGGLDMGVLRSTRHAASALVDTSNALPSESVIHTRSLDRTRLQAVVVNAGNANAQTGAKGIADAATMGATAAEGMDLDPSVVTSRKAFRYLALCGFIFLRNRSTRSLRSVIFAVIVARSLLPL